MPRAGCLFWTPRVTRPCARPSPTLRRHGSERRGPRTPSMRRHSGASLSGHLPRFSRVSARSTPPLSAHAHTSIAHRSHTTLRRRAASPRAATITPHRRGMQLATLAQSLLTFPATHARYLTRHLLVSPLTCTERYRVVLISTPRRLVAHFTSYVLRLLYLTLLTHEPSSHRVIVLDIP